MPICQILLCVTFAALQSELRKRLAEEREEIKFIDTNEYLISYLFAVSGNASISQKSSASDAKTPVKNPCQTYEHRFLWRLSHPEAQFSQFIAAWLAAPHYLVIVRALDEGAAYILCWQTLPQKLVIKTQYKVLAAAVIFCCCRYL